MKSVSLQVYTYNLVNMSSILSGAAAFAVEVHSTYFSVIPCTAKLGMSLLSNFIGYQLSIILVSICKIIFFISCI